MSTNGNGFTQKELLTMVIERLDKLEEKLDNKLDKTEFYKVLGLVATVVLIVGSLSMQ
jgi:transcription termination factor NusB|tara:strand:+ start:17320 stop:17493 length:174 start_codon:yes stop_codon:yes gene_type:complete